MLTAQGVPQPAKPRRVVVLPFTNESKDPAYAWMPESLSENLTEELNEGGAFEVGNLKEFLSVSGHRDPEKITNEELADLALKAKFDLVIRGRFILVEHDGESFVQMEAIAIDAVQRLGLIIDNIESKVNVKLFGAMQVFSRKLATEMTEAFAQIAQRQKNETWLKALALKGGEISAPYDPQKLEYEATIDPDLTEVKVYATLAVVQNKVRITGEGVECTENICRITAPKGVMHIESGTGLGKKYMVRFTQAARRGKSQLFLSLGYPYLKSLNIQSQTNPEALVQDGKIPLDQMNGVIDATIGFTWSRIQFLPWQLRHSFLFHGFYGFGRPNEFSAEYGNPGFKLFLLSLGGGLMLSREFAITEAISFAPAISFVAAYQNFFRHFQNNKLETYALNPEAGFLFFYRFGKTDLRLIMSVMAGSYLYKDQNLSYISSSIGVALGL